MTESVKATGDLAEMIAVAAKAAGVPMTFSAAPSTWKQGEPTPNLNAALAKAQGVMEAARKDSENPAFKRDGKASKYADFSAVVDACRKPLADNGLAFVQLCHNDKDGITVTTVLLHASGESIESPFWVPVGGLTAQEYGKASTYARRFGLQALLGIPADDDDGATAVSKPAAVAEDPAKAKERADRAAQWAKDMAKFEALGKSLKDLEARLGHSLEGPPTNDEWKALLAWGVELKAAASKPLDVEEEARRQVQAQAEKALGDKSIVFANCVDRIRAAKSPEEIILIEAEFVGTKPAPTKGDIAALARTSKDRLGLLKDLAEQAKKSKFRVSDDEPKGPSGVDGLPF